MSIAVNGEQGRSRAAVAGASYLTSPWIILAVALAVVCLALALPLGLPIGPMYWDVFIYYDAANRIFDGQVPIVDFFAPVGPLGYYLFAGWLAIFPNGQPTLLAHWSLLALTLPLMALVLWDVDKRARVTGLALLIPFLIFALLPFNTGEFYPFPGSDGFGIYNRQVCQVLYALVAAVLFVRNQRLLAIIITVAMTALFMLKITGFVAGGMIAAYAFVAGRVQLRYALASAIAFLAILAGLELTTGIVGKYVADILLLVEMNSDTLAPRFLQAASMNFGILAPTGLLGLVLLWSDRQRIGEQAATAWKERSLAAAASVLNHNALWLLAVLFAGIFFETQNTGSQALIFLWPVVLLILQRLTGFLTKPKMLILVATLAAAIVLPPVAVITQKAARAYIGIPKNVALEHRNLKTLGSVNMRPEVERRVHDMMEYYPEHRDMYERLTDRGELASPVLYSDFDFQIIHLAEIDRAIDSLHRLESEKGIRFDTIMALNFVNPLPYLMDRSAPRYIAIGADPMRAVPPPNAEELAAVSATDIVLLPTCPPTTANRKLHEIYAPALTQHKHIKLNACYDAFVNPKFAGVID